MRRSLRDEIEEIERHWGLPPCPRRERLLQILDDMEQEQNATWRAQHGGATVEEEGNTSSTSSASAFQLR